MAKKTKDTKKNKGKVFGKIVKIVLLAVVACIIMFVAHTMRNYFILKNIANKQKDLSYLTSYTIVREGYEKNELNVIIKTFRLKNKKVQIMVRAGYDVTITAYTDLTTGEQLSLFATTTTKQYQKGEANLNNLELSQFGRYATWDARTLLATAIHSIILSDTIDGKDCYKIMNSYGEGTYEYVEKSTGLEIRSKTTITDDEGKYSKLSYNFDKLDESIFELPDLSQYEEIKK